MTAGIALFKQFAMIAQDERTIVFEAENGAVSEYQGGNGVGHHFFCARCGNHVCDYVDAPNLTGRPYVNVNLACLENVAVNELRASPVRYFDGLRDAWNETPSETRHL